MIAWASAKVFKQVGRMSKNGGESTAALPGEQLCLISAKESV